MTAASQPPAPDPEPETGPRESAKGREKGRWAAMLRGAFLVVVVAGAAYWIYRERQEVAEALERVAVTALLIAFGATTFGLWTGAPAWRSLLEGLGSHLSPRQSSRIFFIGQLGKYIPGGVWSVAAHATLGREIAVPRVRSAAASLLTIALSVITAALVGAVLLLVSEPTFLAGHWWVLALVVPLAVLLHPGVLAGAGRAAGRALRRPMPLTRISTRQAWQSAAWLSLGQVANGLGVYALSASIATSRPPALLVIGLTSLATAAGLVVFFAPAGAGVREVIIVLGLAEYVDTGAALLVVILARLVAVVADFMLAGIFARKAAATEPVGRPKGP